MSDPTTALTVIAPQAKYKVGDFVVAKTRVYIEILAVIPGPMPVYLCATPRTDTKHAAAWQTEFTLDFLGLTKAEPDFARWEALRVGDSIYVEGDAERQRRGHTHYVLARIGRSVLLSNSPMSQKEKKQNEDLKRQLDELIEEVEEHGKDMPGLQVSVKMLKGATESDPGQQEAEAMLTGQNAYKVAGDWYTVRQLALMNWELGGE